MAEGLVQGHMRAEGRGGFSANGWGAQGLAKV